MNLEILIDQKKAVIGFVGLGKMGLPSALLLAESGYSVFGIDINADLVRTLEEQKNPYFEPGLDSLLKNQHFSATNDFSKLAQCHVILCAVPTVLDRDKKPDYSAVKSAFTQIAKHLKKPALVVFESNVHPGVTEELVKPILDAHGLRHGSDYFLAYVPIQGKSGQMLLDLKKYPRMVSGLTEKDVQMAALLFEKLGTQIFRAKHIQSVELGKLFANIYKDINVAIANELSAYADSKGIPVDEVIGFANTVPGIHVLSPGIGVGGNCLPVDTYFYAADAKSRNVNTGLALLARTINDARPGHFAQKIVHEARKKKIQGVCLLGAAFRPNTHETAYSPALEIYRAVKKELPKTVVFDPIVGHDRLAALGINAVDHACGPWNVLLVAHDAFCNLDATSVESL